MYKYKNKERRKEGRKVDQNQKIESEFFISFCFYWKCLFPKTFQGGAMHSNIFSPPLGKDCARLTTSLKECHSVAAVQKGLRRDCNPENSCIFPKRKFVFWYSKIINPPPS